MFTINNPTVEEKPLEWPKVKYIIYQKEKGEEGTEHYQGYVIFDGAMRLSALKKINARAHWEKRKGTHVQAKAYCSKEETRVEGPWERGEEPQQGKRSDILDVKAKIDKGVKYTQLVDEHFKTCAKYGKFFREVIRIKTPPRNFKTQVGVIWGPTGVGKSKFVDDAAKGDIYWKSDEKWWDGYEGQTHVCLDDFYGWIKYHDMLRLLDRYPYQVEIKGAHMQFNSKFIWITSNKHPRDWYKDMSEQKYAALERRLDLIVNKTEDDMIYEKGDPRELPFEEQLPVQEEE